MAAGEAAQSVPGTGRPGDRHFDQFYASQFPSIVDFTKQQEINRNALVALLDKIGPAVLLTHSQSGAMGWPVADSRPNLVKAIIAVEPSGPPAHDLEMIGAPNWFRDAARERISGISDIPITYDPPLTGGQKLEFVRQDKADKPDLARCWAQKEPARKLPNLRQIPMVVVTSEASYHAPYDHCTTAYLKQAGVPVSHIYLVDTRHPWQRSHDDDREEQPRHRRRDGRLGSIAPRPGRGEAARIVRSGGTGAAIAAIVNGSECHRVPTSDRERCGRAGDPRDAAEVTAPQARDTIVLRKSLRANWVLGLQCRTSSRARPGTASDERDKLDHGSAPPCADYTFARIVNRLENGDGPCSRRVTSAA